MAQFKEKSLGINDIKMRNLATSKAILMNELFYDISINLSINMKIIKVSDPASVYLNFELISI